MRPARCQVCGRGIRTKTTRWLTASRTGNAGVTHKPCYLRKRKK